MIRVLLVSLLFSLSPVEAMADDSYDLTVHPEMEAFLPVQHKVDSCLRAGAYMEAWNALQEAATALEERHLTHPLSVCRHQQGVVAQRMGNKKMAANYFKEALRLVKETGNLPLENILCHSLADVLKPTDPTKAFDYLETSLSLIDTLFRRETARMTDEFNLRVDELGAGYESALREQKENSRKQLAIVAAAALLLLIAVSAIGRRKNKKQN